jgi:hypothetical protein
MRSRHRRAPLFDSTAVRLICSMDLAAVSRDLAGPDIRDPLTSLPVSVPFTRSRGPGRLPDRSIAKSSNTSSAPFAFRLGTTRGRGRRRHMAAQLQPNETRYSVGPGGHSRSRCAPSRLRRSPQKVASASKAADLDGLSGPGARIRLDRLRHGYRRLGSSSQRRHCCRKATCLPVDNLIPAFWDDMLLAHRNTRESLWRRC